MDWLLIAACSILAFSVLLMIVLLNKRRKEKWEKYTREKRIVVKNGINVKEQAISVDKGAYFAGQSRQYDTCYVKRAGTYVWYISFQNTEDGKSMQKRFWTTLFIGRTPGESGEVFLVIPNDPLISKRHCLIYELEGEIYVKDLNSKNATRVNSRKIKQAVHLKNGDILQVGNTKLKIEFERK